MLNADGGENIYDGQTEHKMLSADTASICMLKTWTMKPEQWTDLQRRRTRTSPWNGAHEKEPAKDILPTESQATRTVGLPKGIQDLTREEHFEIL